MAADKRGTDDRAGSDGKAGRRADAPTEIPARGWKAVIKRVYVRTGEDHIGLIAAGIAFYSLMALFPGIAALLAIAGLVTEPAVVVARMQELSNVLPQQAADIIFDQAHAVAGSHEGGLGLAAVAGILIALYSASRGVQYMVEGLNVAYEEEEKRGFIRRNLVVFGLTLVMIVGMCIALMTTVAVPAVLSVLSLGPTLEFVAFVAQWLLLLLLAGLGIALIYRVGPSRRDARWRWITPGAGLACMLWLLGSVLFGVYVRNFASYNESFGSLAGVIILLMWLWLSAFAVLLGAELDAEMEAQTARDSTVGGRQPRGRRGAVKADHLPGEEPPPEARLQ